MAQEICIRNKFGYCKHHDLCRYLHVNDLCDLTSCDIKNCNKRHPYKCKYYSEHGRCKFNDYCKYKHDNSRNNYEDNNNINEIIMLKEKMSNMENLMKQKEKEFEKLNALVLKLSEKLSDSEKSMFPDEPLQDETDETNLDITFFNPSLETQCDLCDFIAKNIKGLKIHTKSKQTKAFKVQV